MRRRAEARHRFTAATLLQFCIGALAPRQSTRHVSMMCDGAIDSASVTKVPCPVPGEDNRVCISINKHDFILRALGADLTMTCSLSLAWGRCVTSVVFKTLKVILECRQGRASDDTANNNVRHGPHVSCSYGHLARVLVLCVSVTRGVTGTGCSCAPNRSKPPIDGDRYGRLCDQST